MNLHLSNDTVRVRIDPTNNIGGDCPAPFCDDWTAICEQPGCGWTSDSGFRHFRQSIATALDKATHHLTRTHQAVITGDCAICARIEVPVQFGTTPATEDITFCHTCAQMPGSTR